ncbi:MAG: hypothetical protein N2047_08570 [Meiothermus sp.]|nr:hypothetical protein [Meiothermus sp.]
MIEVIEVKEQYETALELTQIEVVEVGIDRETVLTLPEVELVEQGILLVQPEGGAAEATLRQSFGYGMPSPVLLYTATAPKLLAALELDLRIPFNGSGAQLSVGQPGQPQRFMTPAENDPAFAAQYEVFPNLELAPGEAVYLFITPGAGATQGAGVVRLTLISL